MSEQRSRYLEHFCVDFRVILPTLHRLDQCGRKNFLGFSSIGIFMYTILYLEYPKFHFWPPSFLVKNYETSQTISSWISGKVQKYRVILKKVSFGNFRTIMVSKEEKIFTIKSKDKGLSQSKFSLYLVMVKINKIRHSKGHISQKNHDSKIIFMQKQTLTCYCTKFLKFLLTVGKTYLVLTELHQKIII